MSARRRRLRVLTRREFWRVVRFLTVGAGVALTYAILFLGARELGARLWEANTIAYAASVMVQYFAHTLWTFRGKVRDMMQQGRFLGVIGFGAIFSFVATTKVGPALDWPDEAAAALVIFGLPVFNYILYRFWVFRGKR
ncbi:GtrA family protein [Roseobacter sp. HKCCA0434]|uniref:GtrA family protein n=1 Tax=Roseobacter sp. HKCCA0434 TaxID=3079297 RepID=UPI002905B9F0|nr:GtrA family protein [Roseobacter sp. HKCCA0434]